MLLSYGLQRKMIAFIRPKKKASRLLKMLKKKAVMYF